MAQSLYGRSFATVYNDLWNSRGEDLWPFLAQKTKGCAGGSWLDLCCGTGALLKYVTQRGFAAYGVDQSRYQLKYAKKNAPSARLLQADIRNLTLPGQFNVITCLSDSLNYLTQSEDLAEVFSWTADHLEPDGLFAFDMNTYEGILYGWQKTSVIRKPNRTVIVETSFDESQSMGKCRITGFVKQGFFYRRFEEEHEEKAYDSNEIEALLRDAKLDFEKFDGDTLQEPGARTCRLLYFCQPQAGINS